MKKLWGRILLGLLLVALLPYGILGLGIHSKKFKTFAEAQASEYLKADVHIGKIRPGFYSRIILSDFTIASNGGHKFPYRVEVEKLIFKYSPLALLAGRFTSPSSVLMKSPRLAMDGQSFPLAFFEDMSLQTRGKGGSALSSLDLAGGEIRYDFPKLNAAVAMREIRGQFRPESGGKIKGILDAKLQGLIEGDLKMEGHFNPETSQRDIAIRILSGTLRQGILPAGNTLELKARLVNNDLTVDSLVVRAGRSSTKISGTVLQLGPQAAADLKLEIRQLAQRISGSVKIDLPNNLFSGILKNGPQPVTFEGKLTRNGTRYQVEEFKASSGLTGGAFWDAAKHAAGIYGQKGDRSASVEMDYTNSPVQLKLDFEHFMLSGLDLVYKGNALLEAASAKASHLPFSFKGTFETDVFVLEYLPLEDFQGSYNLNSEGFTGIEGTWGKEFKINGDLRFSEMGIEQDLTVRVADFQLKNIKSFASKPLPKELGGRVEGKLRLTGEISKTYADGAFTVSDGLLGKVEYDQAIIQLSGTAPYFKLKDSRIRKGRTGLLMTGAIDLSQPNIFSGVEIQSPDNLVIWRGTEASLQEADGDVDLEANSGQNRLPSLGFSVGKGRKKRDSNGETETTQTREKYLQVGPRFKF